MKIFINNRNYVTWPKAMAEQLAGEGHHVIFIDNDSTYEPLLDFYNTKQFDVVQVPNLGKNAAWDAGIVTALTEPYVVTDPDFDLTNVPRDWPEVLLEGFRYYPEMAKIGLSFDESQVPQENPAYLADKFDQFPNNTSIAWAPLAHGFCNYPCDTSFAVYRPHVPFSISGIRKGFPYTGVHLPWHITLGPAADTSKRYVLFNEEIYYYFTHCENSSCTLERIFPMMREYSERVRSVG